MRRAAHPTSCAAAAAARPARTHGGPLAACWQQGMAQPEGRWTLRGWARGALLGAGTRLPARPAPPLLPAIQHCRYMDLGEEVRFKVLDVTFNAPPTPAQVAKVREAGGEHGSRWRAGVVPVPRMRHPARPPVPAHSMPWHALVCGACLPVPAATSRPSSRLGAQAQRRCWARPGARLP